MTNKQRKYFEFLVEAVELDDRTEQFSMLLEYLFKVPFVLDENYILDEDRVQNGLSMRERYAAEYVGSRKYYEFLESFGDGISVLEFFVSLSEKMSEAIYFDSHLSEFFWIIIDNLGLNCMNDDEFDQEIVDDILEKLFSRQYRRDGSGGGMFYVPNSGKNLTKMDFMAQANLWLTRNFV